MVVERFGCKYTMPTGRTQISAVIPNFIPVSGKKIRQDEDQTDLYKLGRLDLNSADPQPAGRALGGTSKQKNCRQHSGTDHIDKRGKSEILMVINQRQNQTDNQGYNHSDNLFYHRGTVLIAGAPDNQNAENTQQNHINEGSKVVISKLVIEYHAVNGSLK